MANNFDKASNDDPLKNMPIQSESIAFKPEDMILCRKCGKSNPPTRFNCFYCAAELEISATGAHQPKLNLRKLESWEKGFNLIYFPELTAHSDPDLASIERFLSVEREVLQNVLRLAKPLPLVRLESHQQAETAVQNLSRFGLSCLIVSDESLRAEKLPVRLRGMEFRDKSLVLTSFNKGEKNEVAAQDVLMIVTGALFESKTESVEKRKKKELKVLHEMQTSSDEVLIDLYCSSDTDGYRIPGKGFDFSCLGTEKGLLAVENMRKLTSRLRDFAPDAVFVDDYVANRVVLDTVWEIDQRKDSLGLRRSGFGKTDFGKIVSSNNLQQFTKYSRLQRHLL